ncbi:MULTISPECIES: hypothetical protein [Geobacillus]|uniref:hypothetical protein n=1 Tax=Geobacillus TaxID=129337 RepID=UPI000419103B|nr:MULTISPECIES: hypothetical protein [Geobacillus]
MPHKVSLYGYTVCVLCHAGHSEVGSVKQWNMKQPRHGTDQRRLSLLLLGGFSWFIKYLCLAEGMRDIHCCDGPSVYYLAREANPHKLGSGTVR